MDKLADQAAREVAHTVLHGTLAQLAELEIKGKLTTAEMRQAHACLQSIVKKHKLPKHKAKYAA